VEINGIKDVSGYLKKKFMNQIKALLEAERDL
jgi:hypothetical protein